MSKQTPKKQLDMPSVEQLQDELKRTQYSRRYRRYGGGAGKSCQKIRRASGSPDRRPACQPIPRSVMMKRIFY